MLLNYTSRFLICPLVVWLSQTFGFVRYATATQIVVVGLILAVLSVLMDLFLLPMIGNAMATLADLGAATVVLWVAGQTAPAAVVTWSGALLAAALLAATEWVNHSWLGAVRRSRERT